MADQRKARIINKHATPAKWEEVEASFKPLAAEFIVYDNGDKPKIKLGDNTRTLNNLPYITKGMVDDTSLSYNENGTISLNQEYKEYLDNQLYKSPTISTFNIVRSSNNTEVTNTPVSITSFTHAETNVGNIKEGTTLTLKRGSTTVKSGISPSASSTSVDINDSYTPSTAQTVTYTLSGENSKGKAFSKTNSITYYCPHYYGALQESSLTDGTDITSLGLTKHTSTSTNWTGTINITTEANQYVYFVTPDDNVTVTSGGFEVPVTKTEYKFLVNDSEQTYYAYRTDAVKVAGSNTFVIS